MFELLSIRSISDIPKGIQGTPIGLLLEYHNLKREFSPYSQAQLLIGTCMDNRVRFRIPEKFAFVIRAGGANLKRSDFYVSYAIAVGGVDSIALIGHTDCGMVNLESREEVYVKGMMDRAGWKSDRAREYFLGSITENEIGHEVDFLIVEAERMRLSYPDVNIVPMLYRVEDNFLYLIQEPTISEAD